MVKKGDFLILPNKYQKLSIKNHFEIILEIVLKTTPNTLEINKMITENELWNDSVKKINERKW